MKNLIRRYLYSLCLSIFVALTALGQVSDKIVAVNVHDGNEGQPVEIRVDLVNAVSVNQVFLNYRSQGQSDFKRIEMTLTGNSATATIPGEDVVPSEIEYYFVLTVLMRDTYDTYPVENPKNNPLRVAIHPAAPKEQMVTFLSPDTGRSIPADELMIALSLKNISPLIDLSTMKFYIDGNDITSEASIGDSLITLDPQTLDTPLEDGNHIFRVDLFSKKGQLYYTQTLRFSQGPLFSYEEEPSKFLYNISAQLESRHERFGNNWSPYNRGLLNISTERGILTLTGKVYVSNEEKSDHQPINRYFIEAKTPWLRVAYGDDYPSFPSLIMNGKRLRGLTSNLKLGFFNVDFAKGDVMRTVEGEVVRIFPVDSLPYVQADVNRPNATGAFGPYDTTQTPHLWAEYRYGTFKRDLMALRPSFGGGETFQLGFSYLKSKDDVGSINYGIKPQENLVLGTDVFIGAFGKKLQITGQGAVSVYNTDISKGDISDSDIDALFTDSDSADKRDEFKKVRDLVSKFITVNQNLVPLSTEKLTSLLSYEGGMSLDAFNNYLKGTYIYHGSQFKSFGQTYIRTDVKGFTLFDRLRLVNNQVFVSGTFERLEDNTDDTKLATTTFTNWNGSLAYYPRFNFPNITVGYGMNTSTNGMYTLDPNSSDSLTAQKARIAREDETGRLFVQLGYDFNALARHTATFNVSSSTTDDKTYYNNDTKTMVVSTMLHSTWKFPLQSNIGFSLSNSKLPNALAPGTQRNFDYTTLMIGGKYRLLNDRLRLSASLAPTFGDVKRLLATFGSDYSILSNLVASFEGSIIDNNNSYTDTILSLMLKYNM